jgi:hypothetical protein
MSRHLLLYLHLCIERIAEFGSQWLPPTNRPRRQRLIESLLGFLGLSRISIRRGPRRGNWFGNWRGFRAGNGTPPREAIGGHHWPLALWMIAALGLMLVSLPQWWPRGAWPAHVDDLYWYVPLVERAWHDGELLAWLVNFSREAGVFSLNLIFAVWVGIWPTLPVIWTFTSVILWLVASRQWQALALQSGLSLGESMALMLFSVSVASVSDVWIWPMAIQHILPIVAGLWILTLALRNFPSWSSGQILIVGLLLSTLRPSFAIFAFGAWAIVQLMPEASASHKARTSVLLWAGFAHTLITIATPGAGWQVTEFFAALGAPTNFARNQALGVGLVMWLAFGALLVGIHRGLAAKQARISWPNSWSKRQELLLMACLALLLVGVGRWQLSPASLIGLLVSHAVWPFTTAHEEALRWAQIQGPLPDVAQILVGLAATLFAFRWTLRRETKTSLLVFLALLLPLLAQSLYLTSLSAWPWKIPWLEPMHAPSRYLIYVWPLGLYVLVILSQAKMRSARWRKSLWTILAVLNLAAIAWRTSHYASQPEREFKLSQLHEVAEQIRAADLRAPGYYCSAISQVPVKVSATRAALGLPEAERLFAQIEDPFHPVTYTIHRELRAKGCAGQVLLNFHAGEFEIADD